MRAIYFLLITIFIASCSENTININSDFAGISLNKSEIYLGDTLAIYGNGFGSQLSNSKLILTRDSISVDIKASECLYWSNSVVLLINKGEFFSDSLSIYVEDHDTLTPPVYMQFLNHPFINTQVISSGSYIMGFKDGISDEVPEHEVSISNDLEVFQFEVSERLFNIVMYGNYDHDNLHPVSGVSWDEALRFSNNLSQLMDFSPAYDLPTTSWDTSSNGWRLPTEAEWEYLCKAGGNEQTPNGENPSDHAWFNENSAFVKKPIGLKKANAFMLYDILGNVSEWCWDLYSQDYYSISPEIDPLGPDTGDMRVRRGGAYNVSKSKIRSSYRMRTETDSLSVGIRLVRSVK